MVITDERGSKRIYELKRGWNEGVEEKWMQSPSKGVGRAVMLQSLFDPFEESSSSKDELYGSREGEDACPVFGC